MRERIGKPGLAVDVEQKVGEVDDLELVHDLSGDLVDLWVAQVLDARDGCRG